MTVGQYLIASGTYTTEQDIVTLLDYHLVTDFGWAHLDTVTNTATDNDRVWFSAGEVPGKYYPIYFRARANSNTIIFFGYTFWNAATNAGTDEIDEATELRVSAGTAAGNWVFIGNKDVVYVVVRPQAAAVDTFGGAGYWNTNFTPAQDPYPLFVAGQNAAADTFENTAKVRSYLFDPNGFLAPTTLSGVEGDLFAEDLQFLVSMGAPSPRDNKHTMLPPIFRRREIDAQGLILAEVRGDMPGVFQIDGTSFAPGNVIAVSGTFGNGFFYTSKSSNSVCYAIGPVTTVSG